MENLAKQKIVIIGCGNVAWHIAKHLQSLKKFSISVYNHQPNPLLNEFKTKLKCKISETLQEVEPDASMYFICVTDKFISKVASKLDIKNPNAVLVHTSGSAKLHDLGSRVHSTGVFYPLQSFSRDAIINWKNIPIVVESENRDSEHTLLHFADLFSKTVISLDYKNRLKLHLSAVLVNNFTNALYVSAFDLINRDSTSRDLNFEILLPLIEQTTQKIKTMEPRAAQTGPARRNDESVMKKHLELISKQSDLQKIYKQLSKLIAKQQEK